MLEIIASETPRGKFLNGGLEEATKEIFRLASEIRRNFYHVARVLNRVNNERLFVDDGFMSVTEYAEKTFGFKKTLCYNLLQIGETYTAEDANESNLPHDKTKDYTSGQLGVMLPYEEETVRRLADEEEITPYMTVKAIKKRLKAEEGEEEPEEIEETEDPEEIEETEDTPTLFTIKAIDINDELTIVTTGEIPEIIAEAITKYLEEVSQ